MRKKKILIRILAVMAVLTILLVCVILFWLGPVVKTVVRFVIPKALGTPVAIEYLSINPRKGSIELSGFVLHNQDGFGRTNAVALAGLDISLDLGSVFTSTVVVHHVLIDSPSITYEQSHATDNIMAFIRDFEEFARIDIESRLEEAKAREDEPAADSVKVVIVESIEVRDVAFNLANSVDPLLDMGLHINQLQASMTNGLFEISGISISNPARLETPYLFTLDRINVEILPDSIYGDLLKVKEVAIERPQLYLERNAETDTVRELMKITDSFSKRLAADPPPEAFLEVFKKSVQETEEKNPAELHELRINDIRINLKDSVAVDGALDPDLLAGIEQVEVSLLKGQLFVRGVSVANPAGFSSPHLFHLKETRVAFDPDTLLSNQVDVAMIRLDSPEISLEQSGDKGNVAELQALIMGFIPPDLMPGDAPAATNAPAPPPFDMASQPAVIHAVEVTNLTVNLVLPPDQRDQAETDDKGRIAIMRFDTLFAQPVDGRVEIQNLQVANPLGFSNPHLVTIDRFAVDVDPATLAAETLFIEEISIQRPRIAYERQLRTDNIQALQQEIESKMAQREENVQEAEENRRLKETSKEEAQKIAIGHFLMSKGLVKIKLSILPSAPIPLPTIELNDIGDRENGTGVQDALAEIGSVVYGAIMESVSSSTGYASYTLKNAHLANVALCVAVPPVFPEEVESAVDESETPRKRTRRGGRRRML